MLLKRLDDVDLSDIETLRENNALESQFIEFKGEAIGSADKDKREFLADVTAFANAAGGDLILGVTTKDGAADKICGIDLADPDKEKQRLVNILRDGVEPRISGTRHEMVADLGDDWRDGDPRAPKLVGASSSHAKDGHELLCAKPCR